MGGAGLFSRLTSFTVTARKISAENAANEVSLHYSGRVGAGCRCHHQSAKESKLSCALGAGFGVDRFYSFVPCKRQSIQADRLVNPGILCVHLVFLFTRLCVVTESSGSRIGLAAIWGLQKLSRNTQGELKAEELLEGSYSERFRVGFNPNFDALWRAKKVFQHNVVCQHINFSILQQL